MLNLILVLAGCKHHHVGFHMVGLYYNIEPKSGSNITQYVRKSNLWRYACIFFQFADCYIFVLLRRPCHYCYKNSIDAPICSEMLQYGLTYTMQPWSHTCIYDAIRCEPSDVSGYLIRTSGCLIWNDLTSLISSVL